MKKVTLSATLLALTMMGCSDMGVDNSVASTSTNDVKSEQTQNFLAKSGDNPYDMGFSGGNWYGNHNGYENYTFEEIGIQVQMQTYFEGTNGKGVFHVMNAPFNPNFIRVVTQPYYKCRGEVSAYCDFPGNRNPHLNMTVKTVTNMNEAVAFTNEMMRTSEALEQYMGVISSYTAVWNQGLPSEIVVTAVTYNGRMFQTYPDPKGYRLARSVYNTYFVPALSYCLNTNTCNQ